MDTTDDNNPRALGGYSVGILEEYQLRVEEQKKELVDKDQVLKSIQKDFEILSSTSKSESNLLEKKESEIERLKRQVNKLQKENVTIRNDQRKAKIGGIAAAPNAPQAKKPAHGSFSSNGGGSSIRSSVIGNHHAPANKKKVADKGEKDENWLP